MICALCGPTDYPVVMRKFEFAGQAAYLAVCDTCRDRANADLARRESRGSIRCELGSNDVKEYVVPKKHDGAETERLKRRPGRGKRGGGLVFGGPPGTSPGPTGALIVPGRYAKRKQPGAPDQKHIRKRH